MANEKVRLALTLNHIAQWKLALHIGVSEATIARRLRVELPEEEQEKLIKAIEEIHKNEH